jgi:hypothetical protein
MKRTSLPLHGRRWLAKTGKDEETHRPFYGSPVDLGGSGRPIPDSLEQG